MVESQAASLHRCVRHVPPFLSLFQPIKLRREDCGSEVLAPRIMSVDMSDDISDLSDDMPNDMSDLPDDKEISKETKKLLIEKYHLLHLL